MLTTACYIDCSNEDCLYLHVYAPQTSPDVKLPVMFWIFGGVGSGGCACVDTNRGNAVMGASVDYLRWLRHR